MFKGKRYKHFKPYSLSIESLNENQLVNSADINLTSGLTHTCLYLLGSILYEISGLEKLVKFTYQKDYRNTADWKELLDDITKKIIEELQSKNS